MNLTEQTALQLRHYCTSIEDALRSLLNTKDFLNIDDQYWINSLTNFSHLLNEILGKESKEYKKLYSKIFLMLLKNKVVTSEDLSNLPFELSSKITNEVYPKLYGMEL